MRRIIAVILLIIGACFLIFDGQQYARQQINLKEEPKETNTVITQSSSAANSEEKRMKDVYTSLHSQ